MNICVIGAGAMGSAYGGLLARAGHNVLLIDRWREHVDAVNARGLRLDGVMGNLSIGLRAQEAPTGPMPADVAMIWTDSNNTRDAARQADQVLGPAGYAVSMQNGIGNVETLIDVLGPERVIAGSSMASAAMRGPGHASLTHMGMTSVGEMAGGTSPRVERLCAELGRAGFDARVHHNIMALIWSKFALNCAINALCAITGLRLGELARLPAMADLQNRVIDEVLAVSAAKGVALEFDDFRQAVRQHCWWKFSRPSMLQHIQAGRQTEIDALNARLVEEGRQLGIATPYNEAVACLLKGVEYKRRHAASLTEEDYAALERAAQDTRPPA